MCKMYCGTPRMVELANLRPTEYDAHTENARLIFKKNEITKDERYLGKRTTHASQRGMRGKRLCENIMKDTKGELYIPPKKCDKLIDTYLDGMWEIRDIFHPWVRKVVREERMLVTSWGRRVDLSNRRIDEDLYREAYSTYMQAEAADWTNQYGFIPGTYYMLGKYTRPLNAQVHDEVIASVPILDSWDYARFIVSAFEQRREIPAGSGNFLCVPAEITVGRSWGDARAVEFKALPHKADFFQALWKGGFFE